MLPCLSASTTEAEAAVEVEAPLMAPTIRLALTPPLCTECGHDMVGVGESAGLCRTCLNDAAVRLRHGLPLLDFRGPALLPPLATAALPGSEAKLVVLEERARLGQALWHPHDAPMDREAHAAGVDCQVGLRHSYGRIVRLPKEVYEVERESVLEIVTAPTR